ncbi:MAG: GAF domain-containing protein, partial [Ardenticatenia bacterium]
ICTDTRLRAEHADLAATLDALVNTTQQRYVILPLSIHDVESALILFYAAEKRFTSAEQAAWHATRRVLRRAIQVSIILDTAARQLRDLTILYQVHSLAQEHASPESLARHLIPTLTALLGAHHVRFYLHTNQQCICQADATTECKLPETALSLIENQIAGGRTRILQGDELDPLRQFCSSESCSTLVLQPLSNNHPVGFLWVEFTHPQQWTPNDQLLFSTLGRTIGGTIANLHLLRQTESRLRVLESVHHVSRALREAQSAEELLEYLLEHVLQTLRINTGSIWLYNEEDDQMYPIAARGWLEAFSQSPVSAHGTIGGLVLAHKQTIVAEEFRTDPRTNPNLRDRVPPNWGGLCIPLRHDEHVEGVMYLAVPSERRLAEEEILIAETLAEIGATALNRMRLHQETQQRVRQLEVLRTIDRTITGSMDLHLILKVILDHLIQYTQADAALVSLYNANANLLEFGVGQGFYSYGIRTLTPHLSEGLALKALHEHRMLFVQNLAEDETFTRTSRILLENEHFVSGYFVPLYAKGAPKGVLELYFRRPTTLPSDTLEFIETVAQQAAIAIETAQLFEDLQRSNVELSLAYDATIEGWARALELRDEETEGHSQRVTEMTLLLARAMGIQGEDLVHIRRGALLHDIGKMGIPDSILLKPGPLTDEEWEIMRQHPVLAYKLLSPIPFLRPALDIPYCHHEKWDGTGYPRGLKGEEIPLAARIFAVVDVWDALLSDRPYRKGWPPEKVYAFIQEQAGKHFDPKVVDVFLKLWTPDMGHTVPTELPLKILEALAKR